jgi:hypothetical protein
MAHRTLAVNVADSSALSNSTTETLLASCVLPAYHMQVGKRYRVRAQIRATATNSTDTLAANLRVGPTTLTGTAVVAVAAVDVADNNATVIDAEIVCRSTGSAGEIAVVGFAAAFAAEGTASARVAIEEKTSFDTTVAERIELTGTWSVASSSNSCVCEYFVVEELT